MKKFDLVVIGGGVGGLVAASGAAQLGARVALVEKRGFLGGDCLASGCVPTKRLVYSAKVASLARRAFEFGVECPSPRVNFPRVMEGMREVQKKIGEHDSPERFRKMGVEVVFGSGAFKDDRHFEVNGETLRSSRFIIATGSGPVILPVPGLRESGVLTNETVLELAELPRSMVILGGGPIGIEFAQVFSRLGTDVTVIEKTDQILPREDKELADMLQEMLEAEGIKIEVCTEVKEVKRVGDKKEVHAVCPMGEEFLGEKVHGERFYNVDEVMFAIGRSPNVEGLNLEAAGVEYDRRHGIKVDETLRTSNKHIYACGDVIGQYMFTHVAEYQAGIIISNALFPFVRRKVDYTAVPWVTFTDPELGRCGLTEKEAKEKLGEENVRVYRFGLERLDRAVIEGEGRGMVKIVCDTRAGLLGAHLLGPHAGEYLHEYVLAMQLGIPVTKISRTMHVYPTSAQAAKRASDEYYREKLFTGSFPKISRWLIRRLARE